MRRILALTGLLAWQAAPAAAESISFEEVPPHNTNRATLSEEYAHLGVHFVATDEGAIWQGMSDGDPGGWSLEGTNGPSFLGFNGRSFSLSVWFDAPVPAFRVDVAGSAGGSPGSVFALEGYRDGVMVERTEVVLGGTNEWVTASLQEEVDEVVWIGDPSPFGADNVAWGLEAPSTLEVAIDVRPDSDDNPLNPGSGGMVPVALMGSAGFDVSDVDPGSLLLGVDGAPARMQGMELVDVDGDGWMDLVAKYRVRHTGTAYGDTSICLTGATLSGAEFSGCDAIRTVPRRGARGR